MRWRHLADAWIPVLISLAVITLESTPLFGADHTSGPLRLVAEFLFNRHFSTAEWEQIHHAIRKCGHFVGYGLLSASIFRAVWMTFRFSENPMRRRLACHGVAMLGTLLVASSDELHQLFLPNRTSSIGDVGIDCAGGLAVQLLIWLLMSLR